MVRQLTRKQRTFVTAYVETGIGVNAALATYNANPIAGEKMNLERIATKRRLVSDMSTNRLYRHL